MANRTYRLKIIRGDQQFEAEGDKAFVLEQLKRFEGSEGATPVASPAAKASKTRTPEPQKALGSTKGMSVGEFIRQFGFKRHTDLVLAFGYYLEQHGGLRNFTSADINNCYYEAKMESSNSSQMIIQNIRRGFVMEAKGEKGGKRRYTLTRTGEDYLKEALKQKPE